MRFLPFLFPFLSFLSFSLDESFQTKKNCPQLHLFQMGAHTPFGGMGCEPETNAKSSASVASLLHFFQANFTSLQPLLQVPLFCLALNAADLNHKGGTNIPCGDTQPSECRFCWPLVFQPSPRGRISKKQTAAEVARSKIDRRESRQGHANSTSAGRSFSGPFSIPPRKAAEQDSVFWPALSRNCEGASAGISEIVCRCTSLEIGRLGIVSEELRDGSGMQRHRDAAATVAAV